MGLNHVGPLMRASFDTYTTYVYDQRLVESVDAKSMDVRANLGLEWILVDFGIYGESWNQSAADAKGQLYI